MIFSKGDHIKQIIEGTKTQTRRSSDRYQVGKLYSIQPSRTEPGIPDGKIYIGVKTKEWKPDLSDLPEDAHFAIGWRKMESGYPILEHNAKAEGGYTSEEYEELYEKMHPNWTERWAYDFAFFTAEEIRECTQEAKEQ